MPRSSLKSNKLKIWKRVVLPILAGLVVAGFFAFANPTLKTSVTAPIQNGLVGYWNMDSSDIYGFTLYDKSGNGNNGTIYGATTTTGKIKQALSFDGVDDYVDCGNLGIGGVNTREFWFKPNNLAGSLNQYFLDFGGNNYWVQIYDHDSDGKLEIRAGAGSTTYVDGIYEFTDTFQWYHVAVTMDSSNILTIYVNGNYDNSGSKTPGTPGTLSIGRYGGGGYHFNGLIDEVRIYNRALSPAEILQHYNSRS